MISIDPLTAAGGDDRHRSDRCSLRDVHIRPGYPPARGGGDMEQLLVSTVVLRRDQLYRKLGLYRLRRGRIMDRRLRLDHIPTSAAWRAAGGRGRVEGSEGTTRIRIMVGNAFHREDQI